MVLEDLGGTIVLAIQRMVDAKILNEEVLDECLNTISDALLQSDFQINLIHNFQTSIKNIININDNANILKQRKIIQQAIFNNLCKLFDPEIRPPFTPTKGETSVVLFVGFPGSGKTSACAKYASYHQEKGWKTALVCADTSRAGAFDQLKQNAMGASIPVYGSYVECDPVKIAVDGLEIFKKENCDLIVVDTGASHNLTESSLFEEISLLYKAMKPDLIVLVLDGNIGQAAFYQARDFKHSFEVGAVIITKLDGHAKGGGAISAVAAANSPVIFIGTGDNLNAFEAFDAEPFVSHFLGIGDRFGFVIEVLRGIVPRSQESKNETSRKISEGEFSSMIMYDIYQEQIMTPESAALVSKKGEALIKRYMAMMESMTNEELESTNPKIMMTESSIMRIARDSGCQVPEVLEMLDEFDSRSRAWLWDRDKREELTLLWNRRRKEIELARLKNGR